MSGDFQTWANSAEIGVIFALYVWQVKVWLPKVLNNHREERQQVLEAFRQERAFERKTVENMLQAQRQFNEQVLGIMNRIEVKLDKLDGMI